MKAPKELRTYCPRCNTHTEHTLSLLKTGMRRKMAAGERHHERVDRHGYGGSKAPIGVRGQVKKMKTTDKKTLKLKCKACGYTLQRVGVRLAKMEIAA